MLQSSVSFCDKHQAKSHLGGRGLFYLRSYISSQREVKREVKELIWIQERKQRGKRSAVSRLPYSLTSATFPVQSGSQAQECHHLHWADPYLTSQRSKRFSMHAPRQSDKGNSSIGLYPSNMSLCQADKKTTSITYMAGKKMLPLQVMGH